MSIHHCEPLCLVTAPSCCHTARALASGFGYTSAAGATSDTQCYPTNACPAGTEEPAHREISSVDECVCRPGFGLSSTPGAKCSLCPSGTYSPGGSLDQCRQCPFGTVSRAGATHRRECELSPQACPIGQWAPEDAVSREQCVCYPGYGGKIDALLLSIDSGLRPTTTKSSGNRVFLAPFLRIAMRVFRTAFFSLFNVQF